MVDYMKQLEQIEKDVQLKKLEKVRLEERVRQLEEQKEQILKELSMLGVSEVGLDEFLEKEENEIRDGINKCQTILLGK